MKSTDGGKKISIIGFRDVAIGNVDIFLKNIKAGIYPTTVQIVDAMKIAGKTHLYFAVINAQKSFDQGRAISENIEMETLLYASGTRQITRAIEMLGIKPTTTNIAVVLFTSNSKDVKGSENGLIQLVPGLRDDSVLETKEQGKVRVLMDTFSISEVEVKTMTDQETPIHEVLTWLIVERASLLSIKQ